MSAPNKEETLLFGAVAVELEDADRDAIIRALDCWGGDPSRSIASLLDEQGVLDARARARVEKVVRRELERHGNDPKLALATIGVAESLRSRLASPCWASDKHVEADDPMRTGGPTEFATPFEPGVASVYDPFETHIDATVIPAAPQDSPASDINPIPSGIGSDADSGKLRTPDLRPPSSMDLPSGGPSAGSDLPRFDPYATAEADSDLPSGFDPDATSGAEGLAVTEADTNATNFPIVVDFNQTATVADGNAETFQDFKQVLPSGSIGRRSGSSSRFRVVRPHARGGLGSVLIAFDEELRREVALKEIQERHADNPDSRSRFLVEAEITGGLEHPGVVPVYSLGQTPEGRPFYAMRFIRGESLRKAIERFHSPEHGPKDSGERTLQLRGLLRRFIDVCNALEYAHSRGVIHRDIKPDNIMLGPYGETLLVDWGLAKALDHIDAPSRTEEMPLRPISGAGSTPTIDGSAVGTPAFMSPEQAEGDLSRMGPASDVYSLGATLYQILTGLPPFTERNLFQVLLNVRNGEFPPPRQVKPDVPPAMEAICLTAMARQSGDRYDSCRSLADDLEHWLADEPVGVYVEPWAVRLGRWARRHRTIVASTAVLLITAVVGLTIGTILLKQAQSQTELQRRSALAGWREAERNEAEAKAQKSVAEQNAERARRNESLARENARIAQEKETLARLNADRAETQRSIAENQRQVAERNFQQAIAAVDALLTEVGEIDLVDVPQMEETRRDLLSKARDFYENFLEQNESSETRQNVGRARSRLGDIHELLGEYNDARSSYDAALEIQVPLAEANPEDDRLAADLARTQHKLGVLLKNMNAFEESETLLKNAMRSRAKLFEANNHNPEAKADLASSAYQLGAVLARLVGRRAEAEDLYNQAISLQREVVEGRDANDEEYRELARFLNNLALLFQGTNPSSANATFEESVRLQRRLVEEHSDVPHYIRELARTLNNRVRDAIVNAPASAEGPLRESIGLAEQLTRDYPKVPEYWSELGGYLNNLGRTFVERGRLNSDQEGAAEAAELFQRAEDAFQHSEAIRAKLAADYPLRVEYRHRLALIRHNLARFLRGRGNAGRAYPYLESAEAILREIIKANPLVPEYQKDLALVLSEQAYLILGEDNGLSRGLAIATEGLRFAESAAKDRGNDLVFLNAARTLHLQVAYFLHDLGRHQEIIEHATFLGESASEDPNWLFYAGELFLISSELAASDMSLPEKERKRIHDEAFTAASLWLDRAAKAGYRSPDLARAAFGRYSNDDLIHQSIQTIEKNLEAITDL